MLSIIMPFYRKDQEFNFVFTHYNLPVLNHYPDLELLIVVDDPHYYEEMLANVQRLSAEHKIRFSLKIVLNEQAHDWRPPCIAINAGIRQAQHEVLLVLSPETIILPNSIESLYKACTHSTFAIGLIKFITLDAAQYKEPKQLLEDSPPGNFLPYGSIMFTKQQAHKIGGYDESFSVWGGDDDDFRYRLKLAGFKKNITLAWFLHVNLKRHELNGSQTRALEIKKQAMHDKLEAIRTRTHYLANDGTYGLQHHQKLIFHYEPN